MAPLPPDNFDRMPVSRGDLDRLAERLEHSIKEGLAETRATIRGSEAAWQTEARDFRQILHKQQVQIALHAQAIERHGVDMRGAIERIEREMKGRAEAEERAAEKRTESARWMWAQIIAVAALFGSLFGWGVSLAGKLKP